MFEVQSVILESFKYSHSQDRDLCLQYLGWRVNSKCNTGKTISFDLAKKMKLQGIFHIPNKMKFQYKAKEVFYCYPSIIDMRNG